MVQVKIRDFSDKSSMELYLLREITTKETSETDIDTAKAYVRKVGKLNSLFNEYRAVIIPIKITEILEDNKAIGINDKEYYVFENVLDLKVDDWIYTDGKSVVFRVDEDAVDPSFLNGISNQFSKGYKDHIDSILSWETLKNVIGQSLNRKEIEDNASMNLEEYKEKKAEEEAEEAEQEARRKKEPNAQDIWNTKGEFKSEDIEVADNKIIKSMKDGAILTFIGDKANEVLNWYDLFPKRDEYSYSRHRPFDFKSIVDKAISKDADFKYELAGKKNIDVHFEKYNNTVNGIRICRDKALFIVGFIYKCRVTLTEKQILTLNKLPQIKIKLMELKEILLFRDGGNVKIPISFEYHNEEEFRVELLNNFGYVKWVELKDIFGISGSCDPDTNIYPKSFFKLTDAMGIARQQIYEYLKKIVMLQQLSKDKEEDDNDD